jgi:hypothetical protein
MVICLWFPKASSADHSNEMLKISGNCDDFVSSFRRQGYNSSTLPDEFAEVLSHVDHIFVLSLQGCDTKLPLQLRHRSKCINGKVLDGCIPKKFIRGSCTHELQKHQKLVLHDQYLTKI